MIKYITKEENEKLKEVMNYIIKEKEKIDNLLKEEFEMAETLLLLEKRTILQNIAEIMKEARNGN